MIILKGKIAKSVTGALGLNIVEAGLGFLTAMVLGQLMGAANYGIYSYALALAGIFTILGLLGQDRYAVREIAKLNADQQGDKIGQFVVSAFSKVTLLILVLSGVAILTIVLYQEHLSEMKRNALMIAILFFAFSVYMRLYIALFQGLQKIILSLYAEKLIKPLSFLLLVLLAGYLSDGEMGAEIAFAAHLIAAAIALVVIFALWRRIKPYRSTTTFNNIEFFRGWRPALPFALVAGVGVINQNVDVLMLGMFVADSDIGIYRIGSRVASLIAFALTAVNAAFGPNISELFARNDFVQLQENATKAALAATVFALPCFLLFSFAGYWVLYLFGQDFTAGTDILKVLSVGQFVNAMAGSVALILMMTNHAKKAANSLLLTVVLNIVLNFLLIPRMGVIGAAYATSCAVVVVNLINVFWVWKYLKINSTILGFVFKKYS